MWCRSFQFRLQLFEGPHFSEEVVDLAVCSIFCAIWPAQSSTKVVDVEVDTDKKK